jgi:LEA14-like dessication related protein
VKSRILFLLLSFLIFIFSACQTFNSVVEEPKVSLNSVDVTGITLNGVELVVHVDVENPNAFSVPLPDIDWELFIDTSAFLKGAVPNDKNIAGRGKVTLDFPVSVTYEGLYRSFKSLAEKKEIAYNIALGITFPIPIIQSKVYRLDFSGIIPLPSLPKLTPGAVRIAKIDFSGVELACNVGVENPNVFSIPFPKLDWDYGVNGVSLVKSTFSGAGEIAAGTAAAALISVKIAYADIFKAVDSARNSSELKSNFSLDSAVPIPGLDRVKNILEIPGTLPILQKPEISFQGIRRMSLGTTMEFVINWEVDNKNIFEFDIGEFNYNFKVNNNQWAAGRINNPPRVKANGKTVIPLTVSISALPLVRELVNIFNRDSTVNYSCAGNMDLSGNLPGLDKLELPLNFTGSTKIR